MKLRKLKQTKVAAMRQMTTITFKLDGGVAQWVRQIPASTLRRMFRMHLRKLDQQPRDATTNQLAV